MKLIYKILSTGLVAGALLLAGCAAEKKSAPSIDTASLDEKNTAQAVLDAADTAFDLDVDALPTGVAVVQSDDGSTLTFTFTNYDAGGGDTLNGELVFKVSGSQTQSVVRETGTLVISGTNNGTVKLAVTTTFTSIDNGTGLRITVKGTITIDGNEYSLNDSVDIPLSSVSPNKLKLLKLK